MLALYKRKLWITQLSFACAPRLSPRTARLGDLGGEFSVAQLIDDDGRVAGSAGLPDHMTGHSFLWTPRNGILDLGTPVNPQFMYKSGQILSGVQLSRPVLWTPPSKKTLIPGINQTMGFNLHGQIVGFGQIVGLKGHHPLLMTPVMHVTLKSAPSSPRAGAVVKLIAKVKCIVGPPPDGEQVTFKDGTKSI